MPQLGLLLWLLIVPGLEITPPEQLQLAEVSVPAGPCVEARRLAAQGPCLRPEDCGALQDWKRLFGAPRTEHLDPQLADRMRVRAVGTSYLCLARR